MSLRKSKTFTRHLRKLIKDLPVKCRWKNQEYTGTQSLGDGEQKMVSGGIMDMPVIKIVYFVRDDWQSGIPATADLFEIQDPATDKWHERAVETAEEDQSGVGLIVELESANV